MAAGVGASKEMAARQRCTTTGVCPFYSQPPCPGRPLLSLEQATAARRHHCERSPHGQMVLFNRARSLKVATGGRVLWTNGKCKKIKSLPLNNFFVPFLCWYLSNLKPLLGLKDLTSHEEHLQPVLWIHLMLLFCNNGESLPFTGFSIKF